MKYLVFTLALCSVLLVSCSEPHPLFGQWADNRGNTISLFEDDTFTSRITSSAGVVNYEGSFVVLLNSLTFNCSIVGTNVNLKVVTEWDIRGNMLFIDWPRDDGGTSFLTLYKISN